MSAKSKKQDWTPPDQVMREQNNGSMDYDPLNPPEVDVPDYLTPDLPVDEEEDDAFAQWAKRLRASEWIEQQDTAADLEKSIMRALKAPTPALKIRFLKTLTAIYQDAESINQIIQVLGPLEEIQDRIINKVVQSTLSQVILKAAGQDFFVSGYVSDNTVDLDSDRMSLTSLKSMCDALNNNGLMLNQNHEHALQDLLGVPTRAELRNGGKLWTEFKIFPEKVGFIRGLIDSGAKLGFSIEGSSKGQFGYSLQNGRQVREIPDMDLYGVGLVSIPANSNCKVEGYFWKQLRKIDRQNN